VDNRITTSSATSAQKEVAQATARAPRLGTAPARSGRGIRAHWPCDLINQHKPGAGGRGAVTVLCAMCARALLRRSCA